MAALLFIIITMQSFNDKLLFATRDNSICSIDEDGTDVKYFDLNYHELAFEPVVSFHYEIVVFHTVDHRTIVYYYGNNFDITHIIQNYVKCTEIIGINYLSATCNSLFIALHTSNNVVVIELGSAIKDDPQNNYVLVSQIRNLNVNIEKMYAFDHEIVSIWSNKSSYVLILTKDNVMHMCIKPALSYSSSLEKIFEDYSFDNKIYVGYDIVIIITSTGKIYHKSHSFSSFQEIFTDDIVITKAFVKNYVFDNNNLCYRINYYHNFLSPFELFNNKQIVSMPKCNYVNYYDDEGKLRYAYFSKNHIFPIEYLNEKRVMYHDNKIIATSDGLVYKITGNKHELTFESIPFFEDNPVAFIDTTLNVKSARSFIN